MVSFEKLGKDLYTYCNNYKVPVQYVFEILNDQKVVPMIRGKATEYNVYILLAELLNPREWSVDKLNLNPQPGTDDEDISITHKRTGIIIKIECKNAVRASMSSGKRARFIKVPHCKIKCHKSRSNTKKLDSGNDKYTVDSFDIIISNLSNAIIKPASIDENFELLDDKDLISALCEKYGVENNFSSLFDATAEDWRYVNTQKIAEGNFIPRTPSVLLNDDPEWKPIKYIESDLLEIVKQKLSIKKQTLSRR